MKMFHGYLVFNGNCQQAMQFYQQCLGGELHIETLASQPEAEQMSERMRRLVLSATLKTDAFTLIGTDLPGDETRVSGNAIALGIQFDSAPDALACMQRLGTGGTARQTFSEDTNETWIGNVRDKFGYQWIIYAR